MGIAWETDESSEVSAAVLPQYDNEVVFHPAVFFSK
jgi:hypothetical protein